MVFGLLDCKRSRSTAQQLDSSLVTVQIHAHVVVVPSGLSTLI